MIYISRRIMLYFAKKYDLLHRCKLVLFVLRVYNTNRIVIANM